MYNDSTETRFVTSRRLLALAASVVALLILWLLFGSNSAETLLIEQTNPPLADVQATLKRLNRERGGELFPLPFTGSGFEGKPLPGRPNKPLPVAHEIFADVELKLDGRIVDDHLVVLPAGKTISVEGVVHGDPRLNPNTCLGAGLGIVSRSDNQRGWMIRWFKFLGGNTSRLRRTCKGEFNVPNEPGEYVLVFISWAYQGSEDHPGLLAAEYDAVIE